MSYLPGNLLAWRCLQQLEESVCQMALDDIVINLDANFTGAWGGEVRSILKSPSKYCLPCPCQLNLD